MRHVGLHENEVAGTGLGYELEMFAQRMRAWPRTT